MRARLILNHLFLILVITQGSTSYAGASALPAASANESQPVAALHTVTNPEVFLRTPTNATITFRSGKDVELKVAGRAEQEIPRLVLNRNGLLTPAFERTLLLSLNNLKVPRSGLFVDLTIETYHGDPDQEKRKQSRIQVWQERRYVPYASDQLQSVDFKVTFERFFNRHHKSIRTPTDYFAYRISIFDARGNELQNLSQDHAFLMENEWQVPLPPVLEDSPGAAPNRLLLYYCDMIPFQSDARDPESRLVRSEVGRYIQTELLPAMVKAFEVQTNVWNFPWYGEWTNSRRGEDPKILSVALSGDGTWYHGAAPSLGHAMISIRVDGTFGEYSNLTDGILSVFHHELFHNQQRNISLHFGSRGLLSGKDQAWEVFSEGTAVLASAVGQPEIQFEATGPARSYMKRANTFLGEEGTTGGGLNQSYTDIPYQTALYWRFLYERCGGLMDGREDPATGMKIIRTVLEILYSGEVVDPNSSSEVIEFLPQIVEKALQRTPSCQFQTYQASLTHFAEAIYQLRLAKQTCPAAGEASDCGLFDPHHLYRSPNAESYLLTPGSEIRMNGAIPSSYGIDLVHLALDRSTTGRSIQIVFSHRPDLQDDFVVEFWKFRTNTDALNETQWVQAAEPFSIRSRNGMAVVQLTNLDVSEFDDLGLIITRIDSNERQEPLGSYAIQILVR